MSEQELLRAFRRGVRVTGEHSIHPSVIAAEPHDCSAYYRTVACADERDVVECSKCGKQREVRCTFDEECS